MPRRSQAALRAQNRLHRWDYCFAHKTYSARLPYTCAACGVETHVHDHYTKGLKKGEAAETHCHRCWAVNMVRRRGKGVLRLGVKNPDGTLQHQLKLL